MLLFFLAVSMSMALEIDVIPTPAQTRRYAYNTKRMVVFAEKEQWVYVDERDCPSQSWSAPALIRNVFIVLSDSKACEWQGLLF